MKRLSFALLAAILFAATSPAVAQEWPSRPIRIIVAFAPGGLADVVARLFAQHLQERLRQPVTVDNRAGAGGIVGTQAAALAAPDGYTLLLTTSAPHGSGPALSKQLPYDPIADFTHVTLLGKAPIFLITRPDGPASIDEWIRRGQAAPKPLLFGSPGPGSLGHLTGELIAIATKTRMEHVPYKGSVPAQVDLLSAQIDAVTDVLPAHVAQVRSGRLRLLAISTTQRSPAAPDVPTFAESGYPAISAAAWFALAAPAKLPDAITSRLHALAVEFIGLPATVEKLRELGLMGETSVNPAAYRAFVVDEVSRWKDVVRAARIEVQ